MMHDIVILTIIKSSIVFRKPVEKIGRNDGITNIIFAPPVNPIVLAGVSQAALSP